MICNFQWQACNCTLNCFVHFPIQVVELRVLHSDPWASGSWTDTGHAVGFWNLKGQWATHFLQKGHICFNKATPPRTSDSQTFYLCTATCTGKLFAKQNDHRVDEKANLFLSCCMWILELTIGHKDRVVF